MHGLTLVPNWVGAALQVIRDRLHTRYTIADRNDGWSMRRFQASGLKRTRLGYAVNAYPGYAFAGGVKPDAGLVIAFVDVGSAKVSFSIQIESGAEATHRSNYAVEYRQDDAKAADDFVANHASNILHTHNVNVAAEDGRLVFRALSESRLANDNIRITTPQLERGVVALDRATAHIQPAGDRIDHRPADPEPSTQEKRPWETADKGTALDPVEEPSVSTSVSKMPIQRDRGIDPEEGGLAFLNRGAKTGSHKSAAPDAPESPHPDVEVPRKAAPFTIDFDQALLRFPSRPEGQGAADQIGADITGERLEVEEFALADDTVWSRNYLDVEEIEPVAGDEQDLPAPAPAVDGDRSLDERGGPEFERPEHP